MKLRNIVPSFLSALLPSLVLAHAATAQPLKRTAPLSGQIAATKGGEQATMHAAPSVSFRKVADIQVKGRSATEATYTFGEES